MIQRKQSLYLLLAILSYILTVFISINKINVKDFDVPAEMYLHKISIPVEYQMTKDHIQVLPLFLGVILIGGSLLNIFLYKKRLLQAKICQFLILSGTALIVAMFFSLDKMREIANIPENTTSEYTYAIVFLALPLIFYFLASKAIIKDEKMVKGADRLR